MNNNDIERLEYKIDDLNHKIDSMQSNINTISSSSRFVLLAIGVVIGWEVGEVIDFWYILDLIFR